MNKDTEIKELKIVNWALLGLISLMILGGAGWYIVKNQDKLDAEMLASLKAKVSIESEEDSGAIVSIDQEIAEVDALINAVTEDELADTELANSQLGL